MLRLRWCFAITNKEPYTTKLMTLSFQESVDTSLTQQSYFNTYVTSLYSRLSSVGVGRDNGMPVATDLTYVLYRIPYTWRLCKFSVLCELCLLAGCDLISSILTRLHYSFWWFMHTYNFINEKVCVFVIQSPHTANGSGWNSEQG